MTIEIQAGKHSFRGNDTATASTIDIQGPTVIKYGTYNFFEALVEQDAELKREFTETTPVMPLAFRAKSVP